MSLGPFAPIPPREKIRRSHINDLRTALTGIQDAYDVAVANGFTGTRGQWLDSLKGEKGDPGAGLAPIGSVETVDDLPSDGNTVGDVRTADDTGRAYRWSGSAWVDVGRFVGDPGPAIGGLLTAADQTVASDASGNAVAVTSPHVYAEARGVVMDDAGAAASNATILQAILDEGKIALLPQGTCYYSTSLAPKTGSGIVGAGKRLTTLASTGSGHGFSALKATIPNGVYTFTLAGVTVSFAGTGTGDGFHTDCVRYSTFRDVKITLFPGSGFYAYGNLAGGQGTWTNRFYDTEFTQNGEHGFETVGAEHNAIQFFGCSAALNGLDGVYAEKPQKWTWGIQVEGNARHGVHIRGGRSEDLSSVYAEHHDPGGLSESLRPPGYSTQSPRYVIKLDAAPDGTRNTKIRCVGALLSGTHNGTSTITNAILYAEHTNLLEYHDNYTSGAVVETIVDGTTVSRHDTRANTALNLATAGNLLTYVNMQYRSATGAHIRRSQGPMHSGEGVHNPVVNGGFDTWTTSPGPPDGWTQPFGGTITRETGTDSGYRAVITNVGSNFSAIRQTVTGPIVGGMARRGLATLVFDAIVPTTNATNTAMVNITCKNAGGTNVGGGYTSSANGLVETDTERSFELQFYVPTTTTQLEITFFAGRTGTSNTDVLKLDRVALYPGEVPKDYAPKMLPAPVAPAAIADTSSSDVDTVEAEVNKLKAALRSAGIIGS